MKKTIKFIIFFISLYIGFFSFSYAAGSIVSEGESIFYDIINVLNILRLPFAIIAGKLFTNDLVYGSLLKIDTTLWNVWNFSRTLSNYIIGFIFIFTIFLFFVGKVKSVLPTLGKITISALLINSSWFLLGILIDISTILIVAVGSLPMHLLGTSTTAPVEKIQYCSKINIDPSLLKKSGSGFKNLTICDEGAIKKIDAGSFFQSLNNLTGPLFFIGSSILNIDKTWGISPKEVKDSTDIKKSSKIRQVLHIMVILLFVTPIILLVIVGIIRVFWLRIYISFSPLLILDYIFGSKYISAKHKNFKLSNVIGLIFQPVLVVMALGVAVIFLATVQTAFIGGESNNKAKDALGVCSDKSLCINKKPIVTMEGTLTKDFMKDVGGLFGYIILTIISFVIMWGLIKIAFHSTEVTSGIADATFDFVEQGLKAVPIIPTAQGGVGIGAVQQMLNNRLIKRGFDVKATEQAEGLIGSIDSLFGTGKNSIGPAMEKEYLEDFSIIKSFPQVQSTFRKFIEDVKKNKPDVIPENDMYFKKVVLSYIKSLAKYDSSVIPVLKSIGIKIKNDINSLSENDLFDNNDFKRFLTGVIKEPNKITGKFQNTYGQVATGANLLGSSIKNIK